VKLMVTVLLDDGLKAYPAEPTTVVKVVRDLKLPAFDARIGPFSPTQQAELDRLSDAWGLSSSMTRLLTALASVSG